MSKRVVITGVGVITNLGDMKNKIVFNLKNLKHGFKFEKNIEKVIGYLENFNTKSHDFNDWNYPNEYKLKGDVLKRFAPQVLYCYAATVNALKDSNLTLTQINNPRTGLFTASSGSPKNTYFHLNKLFKHGLSVTKCSPYGMVASISGTLTFNLVALFKIKGPSCCFVSACASSGHALGYAFDQIQMGKQDRIIITSGEDGDLETILPFAGMRALSLQKDINIASRPFDKKRSGFIGSGGGVTLIVEELQSAKNRNAPIYAEILSWSQTSDGFHIVAPQGTGWGLTRCINTALKKARLSIQSIDYVNSHATSTILGDWAEIEALKRLLSLNKTRNLKNSYTVIGSIKSLTGHSLSMSSLFESIICSLSLKYNFIPGSANIEILDKLGRGLKIIRKSIFKQNNFIVNNSSGFGGSNTCIIFKKYN